MLAALAGCASEPAESSGPVEPSGLYKQRMRELVIALSQHAHSLDPEFIVIPQNGNELLTQDGTADGATADQYIKAIDGIGREDLFYGYSADNRKTPEQEVAYMLPFLELAAENNLSVLVIDYCWQRSKIDDSYRKNSEAGFVSFAAPRRNLTVIPSHPRPLPGKNELDIQRLSEVQNFLFLLNYEEFSSKKSFLAALRRTDYDLLVIDAFIDDNGELQWLEREDVESLKVKADGGRRLVISYLSIGEAEDYRYYWDKSWSRSAPAWLEGENPNWKGNYKVRYWDPEWQRILYGQEDSYLDGIIERSFDGVYLDLIDAFYYFENLPREAGD